jgi:cytochrome c-type biogenesis protein CcmH/NrfG
VRRLAALVFVAAAAAAHAQDQGQQQAHPAPIDQLFSALKAAPTEEAAGVVESRILDTWVQQATPAVRLLLARGYRDLGQHAASDAFDSYDGAVTLQPEIAEAWHGRAMARFGLGDTAGAIGDIEQALQREPRDFAALADLSRIAESQGNWKGALAAWQKVLDLAPHTPGGDDRRQELEHKANGQGI